MAKMNRGTLLKLAKAGKLVAVGSYHFDDMFGATGGEVNEKPVLVVSSWGSDGIDRSKYFVIHESDFKSKCGACWEGKNGHVCLYVHSNCNYDLKIVSEPVAVGGAS